MPLSEEQIETLEKIAESEKRSMGAQAALIIESWLGDRTNAKGAKK